MERPDDALMQSIATLMGGQLDPEVLALDKAYEAVARKIGIDAGELVKTVKPPGGAVRAGRPQQDGVLDDK